MLFRGVVEFGSYELLGRLATGGSAHIFLAGERAEVGYERLVCVKTLTPERANDLEFVRSFEAEAELASHLKHPNCVTIYDLGRERGAFYISMEYILGETLARLFETWKPHDPLPAAPVVSILASACDGLHYAHELCAPDGHAYNLIHRDVSPQNIMISYSGDTKVLDFGIAKAEMAREETRTGVVKGKVRYMSPEQIMSGPLDRRSDVFSLGLVMFEALTGHQVFEGCSPSQIQYTMLSGKMPRISDFVADIDPKLDEICDTALSFQASGRYSTAYVMARELRSYLERTSAPHGREAAAELMRERFGQRAKKRTDLLARLANGQCSEVEIRTTLGARPVMAIDLFDGPARWSLSVTEGPDGPDSIDEESFDDDATILDPGTGPKSGEGPTIDEDPGVRPPSTLDEKPPRDARTPAEPPPLPEPSDKSPAPQFPPPAERRESTGARMKPILSLPLVPDDAPSDVSGEEFVDQTRLLDDDSEGGLPAFDTHPLNENGRAPSPRPAEEAETGPPGGRAPEDTKKVDARRLVSERPAGITHATAVAIWFFGFGIGLLAGVVATLLLG